MNVRGLHCSLIRSLCVFSLVVRSRCRFYPIASSCANTMQSPCALNPSTGVVSAGWSVLTWVAIRSFTASTGAHLFSALEGGFTLRFSVNAVGRQLSLVSTNFAYTLPPTCTSIGAVPMFVWTLVGVTQRNLTVAGNASTEFYINGNFDSSCYLVPYWSARN